MARSRWRYPKKAPIYDTAKRTGIGSNSACSSAPIRCITSPRRDQSRQAGPAGVGARLVLPEQRERTVSGSTTSIPTRTWRTSNGTAGRPLPQTIGGTRNRFFSWHKLLRLQPGILESSSAKVSPVDAGHRQPWVSAPRSLHRHAQGPIDREITDTTYLLAEFPNDWPSASRAAPWTSTACQTSSGDARAGPSSPPARTKPPSLSAFSRGNRHGGVFDAKPRRHWCAGKELSIASARARRRWPTSTSRSKPTSSSALRRCPSASTSRCSTTRKPAIAHRRRQQYPADQLRHRHHADGIEPRRSGAGAGSERGSLAAEASRVLVSGRMKPAFLWRSGDSSAKPPTEGGVQREAQTPTAGNPEHAAEFRRRTWWISSTIFCGWRSDMLSVIRAAGPGLQAQHRSPPRSARGGCSRCVGRCDSLRPRLPPERVRVTAFSGSARREWWQPVGRFVSEFATLRARKHARIARPAANRRKDRRYAAHAEKAAWRRTPNGPRRRESLWRLGPLAGRRSTEPLASRGRPPAQARNRSPAAIVELHCPRPPI